VHDKGFDVKVDAGAVVDRERKSSAKITEYCSQLPLLFGAALCSRERLEQATQQGDRLPSASFPYFKYYMYYGTI